MIMTELVKIRLLLTAIFCIMGLLFVIALILCGVYCGRRMDKIIDAALNEETGP